MLSFFKKQTPASLGVLFFLSICAGILVTNNATNPSKEWFSFFNIYGFRVVFSSVLIFINGFLLNSIILKHRVLKTQMFFPFLFFVLTVYFFVPKHFIIGSLLISLISLISLNRVLSIQDTSKSYYAVFDASFLVGVLCLLHPTSILLVLPVFVGIGLFKSFDWRNWVIAIIGIATPFMFWFTYAYWQKTSFYFPINKLLYTAYSIEKTPLFFAFYIVCVLFLLVSLPFFINYTSVNVKKSSRGGIVFLIFSFVGFVSFFLPYKVLAPMCSWGVALVYSITAISSKKTKLISVFTWLLVALFVLSFFSF